MSAQCTNFFVCEMTGAIGIDTLYGHMTNGELTKLLSYFFVHKADSLSIKPSGNCVSTS